MTNLTITTTAKRLTKHQVELWGNYIHHNCTLENQIIIDSVAHNAVYKTGESYIDSVTPNNNFELSSDGTSKELLIIDKKYSESLDFDELKEILEELKELGSKIDTDDKLDQVFIALCNNAPHNVLSEVGHGHSFDLEDYEEDIIDEETGEKSGILTLK